MLNTQKHRWSWLPLDFIAAEVYWYLQNQSRLQVCVHGEWARWSFICPFPIRMNPLHPLQVQPLCCCCRTSSSLTCRFSSCECKTGRCLAAAASMGKCLSCVWAYKMTFLFLCLRVTFINNKAELKCKAYMLTLCCIAFTFPKSPPPPVCVLPLSHTGTSNLVLQAVLLQISQTSNS